MHDVIGDFLATRKADKLKKKLTPALTPEETQTMIEAMEASFALANWLPDAARRASQIALVSHPSKFSHPSAKSTSIVAQAAQKPDGYLRTGNVAAELDAFGNAAAMDVYKFLSLEFSEGMTILDHLEENTDAIKAEFEAVTADYDELRRQFLLIKKTESENYHYTSDKIKQVYFPVDDGYHLLSILTPSGIVFEMKKRIQAMHFSEQAKAARDAKRNDKYHAIGFDEIYGLTTIGYGGTKPQNISVLNSANGGKASLLSSVPPAINRDNKKLPKKDFFSEMIWNKNIYDDVHALHQLYVARNNNIGIRDCIDKHIQSIIDHVIQALCVLRSCPPGWTQEAKYRNLPLEQKIWLDDVWKSERLLDEIWLESVIDQCSRWVLHVYKKMLANKAVDLGDDDFHRVKSIVRKNKEDLL